MDPRVKVARLEEVGLDQRKAEVAVHQTEAVGSDHQQAARLDSQEVAELDSLGEVEVVDHKAGAGLLREAGLDRQGEVEVGK